MEINFWGVRGSIAAPGSDTALVGGNTSCVEIRLNDQRIILDAGTGIRRLGEHCMRQGCPVNVTLLLSHTHWDHIQGLPFFVPLYLRSTSLHVIGPGTDGMSLDGVLAHQMTSPVFPVRLAELPSAITTRQSLPGDTFQLGNARIRCAKSNHPGGCLAWRIEADGASIVYATDTEHYACVDPTLASFARGADILIYDAQYTPEEYRGESGPPRVGWGHSTFEAGAALATEAGVSQLVLFHHDPMRTDTAVAAIEARARPLFANTVAAREGMSMSLRRLANAA